jgi:rubredoxin
MIPDHLHVATQKGNPGCGNRDPSARLTGIPDLVTCPRCKLSTTFRTQKKHQNAKRPMPPASYAGVAVRSAASLYLRRALKIIERLPMRRTS